jgi:hypothetical protein
MSQYIQLDSGEQFFLSSNTGWGDCVRWSESLPVKGNEALLHLVEYGWSQEHQRVASQIKAALEATRPHKDIVSVMEHIAKRCQEFPDGVILITDGMTSKDVEEGEIKAAPDDVILEDDGADLTDADVMEALSTRTPEMQALLMAQQKD